MSKEHVSSHPVVRFDEPFVLFGRPIELGDDFNLNNLKRNFQNEIHANINCDVCNCNPIKGLRFKCDLCSNFDVCLSCYEARKLNPKAHHKLDHTMIVIGREVSLSIDPNEIREGEPLGQGAFGYVCKATYKNRTVACKKMVFQPRLLKSFMRELSAYNEIKGSNIKY
jgi:hypothetical protein